LGTANSAKIVSLQKILGQLQDAGNSATIAHYLDLLRDAGLLRGLSKYAGTHIRQRAASPKLQTFAPALFTVIVGAHMLHHDNAPTLYGQAIESLVGSHLLNITAASMTEVMYWREGNAEVDFVVASPTRRVLIEVKSGSTRGAYSGAAAFHAAHGAAPLLVVGGQELPVEQFLQCTLSDILR
jgi:predicted AAA+ superfamily ATPase